jgi:hypothetical protein
MKVALDTRSMTPCLLAAALIVQAGCLNLGGRTTYVQENPETLGRVKALETRVAALEQAIVTGASVAVEELPPGE